MSDKHEFLSDGWFVALAEEAQRLLDAEGANSPTPFAYAEVFTNARVPSRDGAMAGYVLTIDDDGKVKVRPGVQDNEAVDCIVRMDYAAGLDSLQLKSSPELNEFSRQAAAAGKLQMTGSLEATPLPMGALHDAMVDRTTLPERH